MPLIALLGAPDGEIIGDPKTKELPTLIWQVQDEETKELSVRAYVSTIPGQSAIILVAALNEFNHSVQRFPSVAQYEGESP